MRIGVIGATGLVGETLLRILEERRFPVEELRLFASERSAGRRIPWRGEEITLETPSEDRLGGLDLVLGAAASSVAREWAPRIVEQGAVLIDNSSAFRQDPDVPLVIPEINAEALADHRGIVANPNCTAAVALMALAPLHREARVRTVTSTSFQSVSGTGRAAVEELFGQVRKVVDQPEALQGHEAPDLPLPEVYPHPLAFNIFPQCETYPEGADTSTEEAKLQAETRKVLEDPEVVVHATAVRVPVVVGHAVSLSVSLERELAPGEARELISAFPGTRVVDRPDAAEYPTPLQAAGIDEVLVGRIRANPAVPGGLSLFAAGDNLRKGAALNVVQIAEALLAR